MYRNKKNFDQTINKIREKGSEPFYFFIKSIESDPFDSYLSERTDSLGITKDGVTKFNLTNPYALHEQLLEAGNIAYEVEPSEYTDSNNIIKIGIEDPLNDRLPKSEETGGD